MNITNDLYTQNDNYIIKYEISFNPLKKMSNYVDSIKYDKKISCYLNHKTKKIGNYIRIKVIENILKEKDELLFIKRIKKNDIISIYDKENNKILIIKILSDLKKETSKNLKIIKYSNISCITHNIISEGCSVCEKSIAKIINIGIVNYNEYLDKKYLIDNFYCCYRNIKVIKEIFNVKKSYVGNGVFYIQPVKYNKI